MNHRDRIGLERIEHAGAPRHAAGVPMLELAPGDEHHRVVGIGPLCGGNDVGWNELRLAAFTRERVDENDRVAPIAFVATRVRHRVLALEPVPGDAGGSRHRAALLVEYLGY